MRARIAVSILLGAVTGFGAPRTLRVCAEPDDMPFSNQRAEGFENRIAELLGRDLNARIEYTWFAQRTRYLRNTLQAGRCDIALALPSGTGDALTSAPYYRSTYVFVYRKDRGLDIASIDDPRLAKLRIGVHIVGEDFAPPSYALARHGIVRNVTGFGLTGEFSKRDPQAELVHAVSRGDVDVGILWGPVAGYFAGKEDAALTVVPIPRSTALPEIPFAYDICFGVRQGNTALKTELDAFVERRRGEIHGILSEYGVPLQQEGR